MWRAAVPAGVIVSTRGSLTQDPSLQAALALQTQPVHDTSSVSLLPKTSKGP